jgi:hypothetical protein
MGYNPTRTDRGRQAAGLSVSCPPAAPGFSSVENGHDAPGKRLLEALTDVLRINRDWLETGKGPPNVWRNTNRGGVKTYIIIPEKDIKKQKARAETLRLKAGKLIRKAEILEDMIAFSGKYHKDKIELTAKEYREWRAAGKPAFFIQKKMAALKQAKG